METIQQPPPSAPNHSQFLITTALLSLLSSVTIPPLCFLLTVSCLLSISPHLLSSEYNISAAAIAIFSLFFMILGTLCVIFSFGKGRDYLLRPAGMFFAFAGRI